MKAVSMILPLRDGRPDRVELGVRPSTVSPTRIKVALLATAPDQFYSTADDERTDRPSKIAADSRVKYAEFRLEMN